MNKVETKLKSLIFNIRKKYTVWSISKLKCLRASKKNKGYCLINEGLYHYGYFNVSMMKCLASSILYVSRKGYIPYIDLKDRLEGEFNWNIFFEQPNGTTEKELNDNGYKIFDKKIGPYYPEHKSVYNKNEVKMWSEVIDTFFKFNKSTQNYLDSDFKNSIGEKERVLGVVCRGTDYITLQPSRHPIQPSVSGLISYISKKMKELNCKYIYLATEEKRIVEAFKDVFGEIILTNARLYYDDIYYESNEITHVSQVEFQRNDDVYKKGIEYLSSINILSKCDCLIGGNCGASQAALYFNNMKYEYYELLDLGVYK